MLGRKQATALGLALVAVLVGAGLGSGAGPSPGPAPTTSATVGQETSPRSSWFAVHVSGWVATPGIVRLPEGSIVADAVAVAGGAVEGALLDSVNLAAPVVEGDHVHIPGPGEDPTAPSSAGGGGGGPVSLNRADVAELESLPGIGPVTAQRIVDHREANGPFQSVDDLLQVTGIGEAKLAAIRDLVVP